jgi:hypothetical protein
VNAAQRSHSGFERTLGENKDIREFVAGPLTAIGIHLPAAVVNL